MNKKLAQNIINKTKDDYNKIADQFASTRKKAIWPDIIESLDLLAPEKGKKVLDIGSGSGRLFPVLAKLGLEYRGIDLSDELIKLSKQSYPDGDFMIGDATNLPFLDNEFDYVVSVAVIYHIPSKELREKVFKEIYRVLKPNGKAYISVWYFWNKAETIKSIFAEGLKKTFGLSALEYGDFLLPWKSAQGEVKTDRYCHAWTLWGLKRTARKTGFKVSKVVKSGNRNLNIIISK